MMLRTLHVILAALCLMAVTAPIYFHIKHGLADALYYESFVTDLFRDGGRWLGWDLFAAPGYFPDILLYIAGYFMLDYTADRMFFAVAGDVILIVLATHYFLRRFYAGNSGNMLAVNMLLMSVVSYCTYTTGMFLYSNASSTHIGTWVLALFALALVVNIMRGARWQYAPLTALVAFAGINDRLFILSYTIPVLATAGLFAVCLLMRGQRPACRLMLAIMLACLLGAALSEAIRPWVLPYDQTGARIPLNSFAFMRSWHIYSHTTRELILHSKPWFYVLMALWLAGFAACIAHVIAYARRPKDLPLYFMAAFTVLMPPLLFALIFVSGAVMYSPYHYAHVAIALPVIMLAVFGWRSFPPMTESAFASGFLGALALGTFVHFLLHFEALKPRHLTVAQMRNFQGVYEKALAKCLDDNKERYGLHTGLADFWEARTTNLFSEKNIRVAQVNSPKNPPVPDHYFEVRGWVLDPRLYASNIDWDLGAPGSRYAEPFYNFVILTGGLTEELLVKKAAAGIPGKTFMCPDIIPTKIMVYDKDSGFDALARDRAHVSHRTLAFQRGKADSIFYPAYVLPTETGVIRGQEMVADEGAAPGMLTFGPYLKLPRGEYKVTIRYDASAPGGWEVMLHDRLVQSGVLAQDASSIETRFTVGAGDERLHAQFRTRYDGKGRLAIHSLTLERLH